MAKRPRELDLTKLVLTLLQSASHRTEAVITRRYPSAEPTLNALCRAGMVELYSLSPRAWKVTSAGRSELRRLRALVAKEAA